MTTTTTQATCTFDTWCKSGHNDIQSGHESALERVHTVTGGTIHTAINYTDGATLPLLWLNANDTELDIDGVDKLIAMLERRRELMKAIAGQVTR